nr:MAG TPA: hypothetical protein [Caudoviricetes sp.]
MPVTITPRPRWRGFSFALHLLKVWGFSFALLQYSHIQAFTVRFVPSMQLYRQRRKTAHRALQWHFLRLHLLNRPQYQTEKSRYNSVCATLKQTQRPDDLQRIPDTTATPRRCTGQHRPPIIIRYIRGQRCAPVMDPCQVV